MSAIPPPPPAQQVRWDRQNLRAQRRFVAAQARQQASLARARLRALRRTSIVGPLLLVALGTTFLLIQLGRLSWPTALLWFGRWWPAILIGAGAVLLLDSLLDRSRGTYIEGVGYPRRVLGGFAGMLLLLLTVAGAAVSAADRNTDWLQVQWDGDSLQQNAPWLHWALGPQKVSFEDLSAPLTKDELLTVKNPHGNITVTGTSADGQVHVSAQRRFYTWLNKGDFAAAQNRNHLLHTTAEGLLLDLSGAPGGEADLALQIPHETAVLIEPGHGELSFTELHGSVEVHEHVGNVRLTGLTGPVRLTMRDDNASVSARSLTGSLTLEGRSGDLALSDINGPVTLHGDFFGTTHLERVQGEVHFASSFTNLACAGIPGDLNIEGRDELHAERIDGPVTLTTTDRNLNLAGVRGGVNISDRNGSVTLELSDPLGSVRASTTAGSLKVNLPAKVGFTITAQTKDGDVTNDFGLPVEEHGDRKTLSGKVRSGGPEINLSTTEGDIELRKGTQAEEHDKESDD